jgi:hypothetical protein
MLQVRGGDMKYTMYEVVSLAVKRIGMCLLVGSLCLGPEAVAQPSAFANAEREGKQTKAEKREAQAKAEIERRGAGEKSRIKVRLRDHSELKGYISRIDATSFELTDSKTLARQTIPYVDVDRVRGPGLSVGGKVAVGAVLAGALVGIFAATMPRD